MKSNEQFLDLHLVKAVAPKACIAFSLWGERNTPYFQGVEENLKRISKYYPGWEVILYVKREIATQLDLSSWKKMGCTLVSMDIPGSWTGMFWRMLPIIMGTYEYVCVRDLDSVITLREASAVNEWLANGKLLHIMRDHPAHTAPIMGGMFGVKANNSLVKKLFKPIKQIILESAINHDKSYWQVDQQYLAINVYPILKDFSTVHDPYFAKIAFPYKREVPHMYIGRATMKCGYALSSEDNSLMLIDEYLNQNAHEYLNN